jgi:hypothetical protein
MTNLFQELDVFRTSLADFLHENGWAEGEAPSKDPFAVHYHVDATVQPELFEEAEDVGLGFDEQYIDFQNPAPELYEKLKAKEHFKLAELLLSVAPAEHYDVPELKFKLKLDEDKLTFHDGGDGLTLISELGDKLKTWLDANQNKFPAVYATLRTALYGLPDSQEAEQKKT